MIKSVAFGFKKYQLHLVVWSVFILWEVVVIGIFSGVFGHPMTYLVHYSLVIGLFYFHAVYALPWALQRLKLALWRLPLAALGEAIVFILLSFLVDCCLVKASFLKSEGVLVLDLPYTMRTLYRGLYFLGFSTGYYYLITYLKEKKRSAALEKQHFLEIIKRQQAEKAIVKAQNAFLMAQINPHFFFNTLDYLYHNVLDVSPASAEAISSLATMMRFAIDADKIGEQICLGDEIEQVENLIYLNQIRQPLEITLEVGEGARDVYIIPLVLLTLAENMFKHGNLKSPAPAARIRIWLTESALLIETDNQVGQQFRSQKSHTGLANTVKRLQQAYGDGVVLSHYCSADQRFKVSISITRAALDAFAASLSA